MREMQIIGNREGAPNGDRRRIEKMSWGFSVFSALSVSSVFKAFDVDIEFIK